MTQLQLAYSTYALQSVDPFEVVRRIGAIGYEGLEINCGDDWPTAPDRFGADQRKRLMESFQAAGFPPPVVMNLMHLCACDENPAAKRALLEATCRLARDLCWVDQPSVVTTTLGEQAEFWEVSRAAVAARLPQYVEIAAEHNVILAAEAHVGQEMDTPEKARWLVETIDHPNLRLNFDYSHFLVRDIALPHALDLNAEYAVHAHIKDGRMVDGQVVFALPGDDQLDLEEYLQRMSDAGLRIPITVEISAQIWNAAGYDPWCTAEHCFARLDTARRAI